jgi:hypothetical protein
MQDDHVIISDEAKTLHFVGQMYKSDYFTEEQMTKYEILSDANKVWDKTLTHFTELFSLRKAYSDDKAANSGFENAAHVRDHSSARSVTTANTESDFTRDLYIESLEESLAAARERFASDTTTSTPTLPQAFDPIALLQTELAEQRKQISDVMAQNAKLITTLSKGGGGDGGRKGKGKGGGGDNSDQHKNPWKEKKLCPNCNKEVVHNSVDCFSLEANKDKRPKGWGIKRGN